MEMELQLAKPLTVCKTLVLPVDNRFTRKKLKFLDKLTAVLVRDGIHVVINEWWTTHRCSMCGSRKVDVEDRAFKCLSCGFTVYRDVNAAFNILIDAVKCLTGLKKQKGRKGGKAKTKVFLQGTGGAVDHPELSMSGVLLSLVGIAQHSVRAEAT
jgi:putative transposase